MASEPTIDFERIVTPISPEAPCGADLRYMGLHDQIAEQRREDEILPAGLWERDTKAANWKTVRELCEDALSTKTKDLQVACWLLEALVRLDGFAGLRDGLHVVRDLHEHFWDGLFPLPDDGDMGGRVSILEWMNNKLPLVIRRIPITHGADGFGLFHHEQALKLENDARSKPEILPQRLADGEVSREQFRSAFLSTPKAVLVRAEEDVQECWDEYERMDRALDARYGNDGPGLQDLREALDKTRDLVNELVTEKRKLEPDLMQAEGAELASEPAEGGMSTAEDRGSVPGQLRSRADAYRMLRTAADYLRRTEPHSPVPYLVDRAIRWGEMPLELLLKDMVANGDVRVQIGSILGITPDRIQ
jgi:type VI secretion system protein ImpA